MPLKPDTKSILAKSLEELLKTKEFESITVNDIVKHCGAGRSTFYKHFKDKYELSMYTFVKYNEQFLSRTVQQNEPVNYYTDEMCEFLYQNRDYYRKLLRYSNQNSFLESFIELFIRNTTSYVKAMGKTDVLNNELTFSIYFLAAAHAYILKDWLAGGCRQTPGYIAKHISDNSKPFYQYLKQLYGIDFI